MKTTSTVEKWEAQIDEIKAQLQKHGAMRPGSLSRQYNVCGKPGCRCKDPKRPKRHGPYYQLNYVFRGKKTSRFIPQEEVTHLRAELANYKTLRRSTDQWTALALQIAHLRRKMKA